MSEATEKYWTIRMLTEILEASRRGFKEGQPITLGTSHEGALENAIRYIRTLQQEDA